MGPFSPPTDLAAAVLRTSANRAFAGLSALLLLAVVVVEPTPRAPAQDPSTAVPIGPLTADRDGDHLPDRLGDTVTVAGRVTAGTGAFHGTRMEVYLQDGTGGVMVFDWGWDEPVEAGDSIVVRGRLDQYRGRPQLRPIECRVAAGAGSPPEPRPLSLDEAPDFASLEGSLVEVSGRVVDLGSNTGGQTLLVRGRGQSSNAVVVFVSDYQTARFSLDEFEIGDAVRVTGVVGQYDDEEPLSDNYQIYPRSPDDLEAVGLSSASYRRILLFGGAGLLLLGGWTFSLRRQVRSRREAQERFESLFEHNVDAVASVDLEGHIREVNPAFESLCGRDAEEVEGEPFASLLVSADRDRAEKHLREAMEGHAHTLQTAMMRPDGERVELELKSVPAIVGGEVRGVYQIAKDVTAFKEFEEELEHRALHDQLTGLPNRALFGDRIDQALRRYEQEEVEELALLLLDLDRFQLVNESAGHRTGDDVLNEVGRRLRAAVRETDTVARFGGDEFAVLLAGIEDLERAREAATRLQSMLAEPIHFGDDEVRLSATVGIATASHGEGGAGRGRDLVRRADLAMTRAKENGGESCAVFDPEMEELTPDRLRIENELRTAIARDELELAYQPVVDLETGVVAGTEALVRWDHPEDGWVKPEEFVPVAEESSLIVDLDRWVLSTAAREIATLPVEPGGEVPLLLTINISARHFEEEGVVPALAEIVRKTEIPASCFQFEITETVAARERGKIRRLQEIGVKVALDDFGTGYSSLAYLKDLQVDVLKIDRSFVSRLGSHPADTAIVETVVSLARSLGMDVIAEGIETQYQADRLVDLGCGRGQGFHLARPMSLEEFRASIARSKMQMVGT